MNVSDLYLYVGFVGGWLVGRRWPSHGRWLERATLASVIVLVALLGASFRSVPSAALVDVLPSAVLFALGIVGATLAIYAALQRARRPGSPEGSDASVPPRPDRLPTSAILVAGLLVGVGIGRTVALPTGLLLPLALAALLALVGYGLEIDLQKVRGAWVPIASASAGAVVAGAVGAFFLPLGRSASFASALGFGWYSLAGPLVAARLGATLGLFAFVVNFLREGLTMVLAPYLGPRLRGQGLAAMGGATSMDTTLYFVVRYGDRSAGALAVASGLTLTVAASLLVPLVLAL